MLINIKNSNVDVNANVEITSTGDFLMEKGKVVLVGNFKIVAKREVTVLSSSITTVASASDLDEIESRTEIASTNNPEAVDQHAKIESNAFLKIITNDATWGNIALKAEELEILVDGTVNCKNVTLFANNVTVRSVDPNHQATLNLTDCSYQGGGSVNISDDVSVSGQDTSECSIM